MGPSNEPARARSARWGAEPDEAIAVYRSMTKPVAERRAFRKRA
jgi:hypothetical protein